MGTPEDGDGGGSDVGGGVGTIVWVRRRNGSWWPGRILGAEELSASHLMSPRSGTPVKLLGREDASVDWYNLEKSKRVKPFRCGEFDSCIQRAKASQGGPVKKREKYARREDAILHALELERKQVEMKQQKSGVNVNSITNKPLGLKRRSNISTSDIFIKNEDAGARRKYALCKLRKEALLHVTSNSVYKSNEKTGKPIKLDKHISNTMPHMKELQDFGSRISPKKKLLLTGVGETPTDSTLNNMEKYSVMGVADYISSRNSAIKVKRKRSGATTEESLGEKLDQQNSPDLDLQTSVELQNSHAIQFNDDSHIMQVHEKHDDTDVAYRVKRYRDIRFPANLSDSLHDGGYSFKERHVLPTLSEMESYFNKPTCLTQENASRMIEAYESDSSQTDYLVSNMEEPDLLDVSDTGGSTLLGSRNCEVAILQVPDKLNVNSSQMPLGSSVLQGHLYEQSEDISSELGVFRWHIKGKRNNRNLLRRTSDLADDEVMMSSYKCNGSLKRTTLKEKVRNLKIGGMAPSSQSTLGRDSNHYGEDMYYTLNNFDLVGDISDEDELLGHDKQKYPLVLDSLIDDGKNHVIYDDWENDTYVGCMSGWKPGGGYMVVPTPYWNDNNGTIYSSYQNKQMTSTLINVDVEVQRGYQGERVPLVSLMSRLNGKAIIGHPIQVEILEDGSADQYFPSSCPALDESRSTYPAWRTSMIRVPRSNSVASSLEGGEDAGAFEFPDPYSKLPIKKYSGHFSHQARLAKKNYHHARQRPQEKYQKLSKGIKFSSERSRTPCSITSKHKLGSKNHDCKHISSHGILGSLIGADGIMPPVTCVPVKVVFSRILEAVGRPSSVLSHRIQIASRALRHPSYTKIT